MNNKQKGSVEYIIIFILAVIIVIGLSYMVTGRKTVIAPVVNNTPIIATTTISTTTTITKVPVIVPKPIVIPNPVVITPVVPTPAVNTFTLADVARHNISTDCYTAVNGGVYNLTSLLSSHPAGKAKIMKGCGIDSTNMFNKVGAHNISRLKEVYLGKLI